MLEFFLAKDPFLLPLHSKGFIFSMIGLPSTVTENYLGSSKFGIESRMMFKQMYRNFCYCFLNCRKLIFTYILDSEEQNPKEPKNHRPISLCMLEKCHIKTIIPQIFAPLCVIKWNIIVIHQPTIISTIYTDNQQAKESSTYKKRQHNFKHGKSFNIKEKIMKPNLAKNFHYLE